jgi:hypothetical protein
MEEETPSPQAVIPSIRIIKANMVILLNMNITNPDT